MNKIDLTGQRFGKLKVIEETYQNNIRKWKCQCDCGNISYIATGSLRSGNSTSCGKCKNTYDLSGEYGIGYTSKG